MHKVNGVIQGPEIGNFQPQRLASFVWPPEGEHPPKGSASEVVIFSETNCVVLKRIVLCPSSVNLEDNNFTEYSEKGRGENGSGHRRHRKELGGGLMCYCCDNESKLIQQTQTFVIPSRFGSSS